MTYERRVRGKFIVVDGNSGQNLGSFFNDEGIQTLSPERIKELLPRLAGRAVRIDRIDWQNYDEVTVSLHVGSDGLPAAPKSPPAGPLPAGIRYSIFNMKDGENLGTFVTDQANSILDKMVLHKMFPQFELKSLRIVSLNWTDDGEVRVYVRGKKDS